MEELKNKIIDLCNHSGLSLEAMYYVVKDVWRDIEATIREYQEQLKKEQEQTEKEKQEEKK